MKMFVFFQTPLLQTLGWALLHSLWQGLAIAAAVRGIFSLMSKKSANLRYLIAYSSLMLMLILPVFTAWTSDAATQPPIVGTSLTGNETSPFSIQTIPNAAGPTSDLPTDTPVTIAGELNRKLEAYLPLLSLVWSLGVFACGIRLFGQWIYTQKLKRRDSPNILEEWQSNLLNLSRRMRVNKSVLLIESSVVKVPTVIGWLKPLILLPPSVVLNLTPQQLEAILAHELAHIRRHDYLANLVQTVVETLLFYHPAAWWISRRIRAERENACDDAAIDVGGNAVIYARALTRIERLRKGGSELALAADGGSLSARIRRLLEIEKTTSGRFAGVWAGVLIVSILAVFCVSANISPLIHSTKDQAAFDRANETRLSEFTNANERAGELCRLGKIGDVDTIPTLIRALGDDESISEPVGCWNSGTWSPLLRTFKQSSPGEEAAMALASMGEKAVGPIVAALKDPDPNVRRNAAWAIGEMKDGYGIDRGIALAPLIQLLKQDDDAWVRRAAAFALSELRDKRSSGVLTNSLNDENSGVREMAANALGEMKERSAIGPLKIASNDSDKRVAEMAKWSLDEIQGE